MKDKSLDNFYLSASGRKERDREVKGTPAAKLTIQVPYPPVVS